MAQLDAIFPDVVGGDQITGIISLQKGRDFPQRRIDWNDHRSEFEQTIL